MDSALMKKRPEKKVQVTREGAEIPIPRRGDFFKNLKKAAAPEKTSKRGAKK
jgi:hypothetical protein